MAEYRGPKYCAECMVYHQPDCALREHIAALEAELWYYDTLKRISNYDSLDYLQQTSEEAYGMSYHEALEFAYDNVIAEAKSAVRGKRRPKDAMSQEGGNG